MMQMNILYFNYWVTEEITQLLTACLADTVMTDHLDACLQFLKQD
jgi:hypothetical protein